MDKLASRMGSQAEPWLAGLLLPLLFERLADKVRCAPSCAYIHMSICIWVRGGQARLQAYAWHPCGSSRPCARTCVDAHQHAIYVRLAALSRPLRYAPPPAQR